MTGRQIRWASVGRAAAIAAAAIAGIVSLPALLGGDKPPPVPADVGLTPPPVATTEAPPAPIQPSPQSAPKRTKRPHHAGRQKPRHRPRPQHRRHRDHPDTDTGQPAAPAPSSVPVPSYAPPPEPGEFRIER